MRTFIAIEIPEAIKTGLAQAQRRLRPAPVLASWSRPEGMHLTLKFLGEIGEERAPAIMQALVGALSGAGRFTIGMEGVGAFPSPANARVVWIGISGDLERLTAVQRTVERAATGIGLEPDDRPFRPHLTLGRIKQIRNRSAWLEALAGIRDFKLPGFDVTSVSLMQSELKPAGAVYREVGVARLEE